MEEEKKPRRPRISETRNVREEGKENYEMKESAHNSESYNNDRQSHAYNNERSYNNDRRSYNNERNSYNNRGGYNNRYNNNGYNSNRNNYNNSGYNNRYNNYKENEVSENTTEGYNNENGYNRNGYNNRYNNNRNSYNNRGGYGNRNNNSYNNRSNNSYGNRNNSYNNRYNNNGYNNGYNNRYNNDMSDNNNHEESQNSYENRNTGYSHYNNRGGYNNNRSGYNNNRGGYGNRNNNGEYNNRQRAGQGTNKRFTPRPQRIEYELPPIDPAQPIRLNKFLANAGICSRREADEFIQAGEIKVNGEVVTELGSKITPADIVTFRDKEVGLENKVYVLLNKPKDCVTTSDDPQGRLTVMDIVRNACTERIYPVGRLDRNTTGVLLLTNDGDLASKLTHPKFVKKKIYHVWTDKDVTEEDMQRIADGIELDDGSIHADAVSYANDNDRNQIGIEIHSGRNRIVRRIFEALGYHVVKLDRVYFAGLTKKNLPRGRWRYLTQAEVSMLMMGAFE